MPSDEVLEEIEIEIMIEEYQKKGSGENEN